MYLFISEEYGYREWLAEACSDVVKLFPELDKKLKSLFKRAGEFVKTRMESGSSLDTVLEHFEEED